MAGRQSHSGIGRVLPPELGRGNGAGGEDKEPPGAKMILVDDDDESGHEQDRDVNSVRNILQKILAARDSAGPLAGACGVGR